MPSFLSSAVILSFLGYKDEVQSIKKTDEIKDDYKLFVNSIQKYCPYLTDWSQPDQPWTRAITIANNKIDTIRWVSQLHKPYNFGYPIAYEK